MITKDEITKTIKFEPDDYKIAILWRDTSGTYKYNVTTKKSSVDNIEFKQDYARDLAHQIYIFDTVEDMNSVYCKILIFKGNKLNEKKYKIMKRKLAFKNGSMFKIPFTKLLLCIRRGKGWFRVRDLSGLYGAWRGDWIGNYWSIDLSMKLKGMTKIGTMERRKIDGHSFEYKITDKGNKVAKKFMRRYEIVGFMYGRKYGRIQKDEQSKN